MFIEGVTDGFFETNLRGDFTFYNNSFSEKFFGLTSQEMKSTNYRKFMDKENAAQAFKTFNQLFKRGRGVANCTWNIKNKDDEIHILEVTVKLISDKENNIVGFRGIAQDITEKHFALQKAIEAEKNAKDINYPRLTTISNNNNYRNSSLWAKRADYLKVANLELGYSLSSKAAAKMSLSGVRIFINTYNLASLDGISRYNLDPEIPNAGVTAYPVMRVFNTGISLEF